MYLTKRFLGNMRTTTFLLQLFLLELSTAQLFTCTFENGQCGMMQDTRDSPKRVSLTGTLDWERRTGATPTGETGPDRAQSGSWYLFIETSDPVETGHKARVSTPPLNFRGDVCVDYYYHMYGEHMGSLEVYIQDGPTGEPQLQQVSREAGDKGNVWLRKQLTLNLPGTNFRVGWEGTKGPDFRSDMAIDTIRINQGSCNGVVPSTPGPPLSVNLPFSCGFETPQLCGMEQRRDDTFDWTLQEGGTPTDNTGPDMAQDGRFYIYIETSSPRQLGDTARIQTMVISASGPACVTFYYHAFGDHVEELQVYTVGRGVSNPWTRYKDSGGNRWVRAQVDVNLERNDRVGFTGVRGRDIRGDIAIDNLNIRSGTCQRTLPYTCDFESADICGFSQVTTDVMDWTRQCGATPTQDTGPSAAQSETCYMYLETTEGRLGDMAVMQTPPLDTSTSSETDICVSFYYHMYGVNVGRLVVYRSSRNENNNMFMMEGNKGNRWLYAQIDSRFSRDERLVFFASRGNGIFGDVAIDLVRVQAGRCEGRVTQPPVEPTAQVITDYFACDMERDGRSDSSCNLQQDTGDRFDWIRQSGKTPSGALFQRRIDNQRFPVTGPDGARQGSYYLYVEASNRRRGDMARLFLRGNDFRGGIASSCLRFWYNMNGYHAGTLAVYMRQRGIKKYPWSISGDQLQNWQRAAVQMDTRDVSEIGVEATMEGFFNGDMAIDEIIMMNSACESIPTQFEWWCNFELSDGSSTFCGMEQDTSDQFDWTLWSGKTPSEETGPERAFNGQWYMYIETSNPRNRGDQARILLPSLGRSGDMCVRFRYHMYGFHVNTLEVYTLLGSTYTSRWTKTGQEGNVWREQAVTVESLPFEARIGFRGTRGSEFSGDIAVDNIRVSSGRC